MRVLVLTCVLAAAVAGAQTPEGQPSTEVEGTEVKQPPAEPGQVRTTPQGQGQEQEQPPGQVHTVERGDTLWDLSSKYLGSPWYWPKVWSYNPQIPNPHWIYPGNQVRFFPGNGEETPARAEPVNGEEEELPVSEAVSDDEVQMVRLPVETKTKEIVVRDGFVTPREVEAAGTLVASFAESEMLSPPNQVYLDFKDKSAVQVGGRYLVFRTVGPVYHPRTGAKLGYQTQVLGVVRVNRTSEKKVRAQIEKAFDEINRGDRIGPAGERLFEAVGRVPNGQTLQNLTVVAPLDSYTTISGEHARVLLDVGSSQGVQVGNTFTIIRQVDPILSGVGVDPSANQDASLPVEDVGQCMAVDVRETVTTCLLTRSLREIVTGDRAEMRASGPQTAGITK
jgi:LysM repeat protein